MITSIPEEGARCSRNRNLPINDDVEKEDDDRFSQPQQPNNSVVHKVPSSANQHDHGGIAPYSIASAIWNHRTLPNEDTGGSASDIVAVVLSMTTTTMQSSTSSTKYAKGSDDPRITLLIGDQSLPPGQCARVTIPASSVFNKNNFTSSSLVGVDGMGGRLGRRPVSSTPTKCNAQSSAGGLGEVQPGDVFRLNRLEVRHDYDNDSILGKKRKLTDGNNNDDETVHNPLLSVACDLAISWRDPAPGPTMSRLCRIIPKPSNNRTHDNGKPDANQNQRDGYDLEWEMIIPPSLETSREVVAELASWYCAIPRHRNSMSTAILPANQRCQRRKLRDISTPNLLSHIVVKVLRCEKVMSVHATPNKSTIVPDVTHVILSDGPGSDDILGMVGSACSGQAVSSGSTAVAGAITIPKSISSVMLQSVKDGAHVLVTHVLSQALIGSGGACTSSLILVPTRETTATIFTPDHPYFVHAQQQQHRSAREDVNWYDSQQNFGMTQQHQLEQQSAEGLILKRDSITPSIHSRGVMAFTAPLLDIIVDGVETSFMEGSHWQSPHALSRFLIDVPRISTGMNSFVLNPSYRSATLILDRNKNKSVRVEKSDGEHDATILVHACGDAMKLLCLDVPVEDMVMKDPTTPDTSSHHPCLHYAGELLRTLCTEHIPIHWVLEQESECNWFVTNATLVEI